MFKKFNYNFYATLIILGGILLRLREYFFCRSLWVDEVFLSTSILGRGYDGLLQPLDYQQMAPFGFLMAERFFVELIGANEFGLRFFPLMCGIGTLILFAYLAKEFLSPKFALAALGFMAINGYAIYYANDVKPYSSDLFFSLSVLAIYWYFYTKEKTGVLEVLLLSMIGAVAVWSSFPSVFVFAGLAVCLLIHFFKSGDKDKRTGVIISLLFIGVNFLIAYYIVKQNYVSGVEEIYLFYWEHAYISFKPAFWIIERNLKIFIDAIKIPGFFYFTGLAWFLMLVGGYSLYKDNRAKFWFLIGPILVVLLANIAKKYPLEERVILFLIPFMTIFVFKGIHYLWNNLNRKKAVVFTCLFLIFLHPVISTAFHLIKPKVREEAKSLIDYLNMKLQGGEVLYVSHSAKPAFRFYQDRLNKIEDVRIIQGGKYEDNWQAYYNEIESLKKFGKVYFFSTHTFSYGGIPEFEMLCSIFDLFAENEDEYTIKSLRMFPYEGPIFATSVRLYSFKEN